MELLEVYKSENGKEFEIYLVNQFVPIKGDTDWFGFQVIPSSRGQDSWHCTVGVGGTALATLQGFGSVAQIITALGVLRIEQAIEEGGTFTEFKFISDNIDKDKLSAKLKELQG